MAEGRAELIASTDRHPHYVAAKFREKYAKYLGTVSLERWRPAIQTAMASQIGMTAAGRSRKQIPQR